MKELLKLINKKGCWDKDKAAQWFNKTGFLPFGFNFVVSYAGNSTEMWKNDFFNADIIDRELQWAKNLNYNCIRVFLPFIVYINEKNTFLKNFDRFLSIAEKNNLSVIPVFFDDCAFSGVEPDYHKEFTAKPYTHNSCWTASPGIAVEDNLLNYPLLKEYVTVILHEHKDDHRILFWDLYNEPGNNNRGAKSFYLLEKSFEWAREVNPSQPLTVGIWNLGLNHHSSELLKLDLKALELSDIITFHNYSPADVLQNHIDGLKHLGYPLICTEWMARTLNSVFESGLPVFWKNGVGNIHWGFVNGKTQTHYPWNWSEDKGEPDKWFHDVLWPDGSAYDEKEIRLIKEFGDFAGIPDKR